MSSQKFSRPMDSVGGRNHAADVNDVDSLKIDTLSGDTTDSVYIIAEIGSNHNGNLETALELVALAAQAGVDAVKFQAFERSTLFAADIPDDDSPGAAANRKLLRKRWKILPGFTAADTWWPTIGAACRKHEVDFICTPFDLQRLDLLVDVGVEVLKIASGDMTWHELLEKAGATGLPVILSTGASNLDEVHTAVKALRRGGCAEPSLLHCVSTYPTRFEEANLSAMATLRETFRCPVGLSDHSPGHILPVAAVALGARIIEKHITTDKTQSGLDHAFALDIGELEQMVEAVRAAEQAMGQGRKQWVPDEDIERYWVRRGLWLNRAVQAGQAIERSDLCVLRPRHGIGAENLGAVLGRRAARDLSSGQPLLWSDVT